MSTKRRHERAESLTERVEKQLSEFESVSWIAGSKFKIKSEYDFLTNDEMRAIRMQGFEFEHIDFEEREVKIRYKDGI